MINRFSESRGENVVDDATEMRAMIVKEMRLSPA
jgi:hypothetical protein